MVNFLCIVSPTLKLQVFIDIIVEHLFMATLSAGISIQPIPILFGCIRISKVCHISTNSVGGVLYLLLNEFICISCWNTFKLIIVIAHCGVLHV